TDPNQKAELRVSYVEMLGDVRPAAAQDVLLRLAAESDQVESVRVAALAALQGYDADAIATTVLDRLPEFSAASRDAALTLIASRPAWAQRLLERINDGELAAEIVPAAVVGKIHLHRDPAIRAGVAKHWGEVSGAT